MRVLGAILAGGQSRRFGTDKAVAMLGGKSLAAHVRDRLAPQVEAVVSCGRPLLDLAGLADRPHPGLGPLAGLNAALHAAQARGLDAVLSAPCDTPFLPADLRERLGGGPAFMAELPVAGLWPAALADDLDRYLAEDARRSVRGWGERVGARAVAFGTILNINTPADLLTRSG